MRSPRLLVVKDNRAVRELWCDALTMRGYDPVPAENGAAALAVYDPGSFDLVGTDLLMPGMSGWQVAEVIRARTGIPIVVVTGSVAEEDTERARARGIPLLQKPVKLADLGRVVDEALRGRSRTTSRVDQEPHA